MDRMVMEAVQAWLLPVYSLAVSAIAGVLAASLKSRKTVQDATANAIRALLKSQLIEYYKTYADCDSIPPDVMSSIHEIYAAYHDLGGNGAGSQIYETLKAKKLKID